MSKVNEEKPKLLTSVLIFMSAYSPLSLIFALQDFSWESNTLKHPRLSFGLIALGTLSVIITCLVVKHLEKEASRGRQVKITHVSYHSGELMNYSIPYMVSFFAMDLSNPSILLSFLLFMGIMFVITLKTHNTFINPLLCCMGYNLYKVTYTRDDHEFEDFLLSKNSRPQPNQFYRIAHLSERLIITTPSNNE